MKVLSRVFLIVFLFTTFAGGTNVSTKINPVSYSILVKKAKKEKKKKKNNAKSYAEKSLIFSGIALFLNIVSLAGMIVYPEVSLIFLLLAGIPFYVIGILSLLGIIYGSRALKHAEENDEPDRHTARLGIAFGIISLVLLIVNFLVALIMVFTVLVGG